MRLPGAVHDDMADLRLLRWHTLGRIPGPVVPRGTDRKALVEDRLDPFLVLLNRPEPYKTALKIGALFLEK